MDVSAALSDEEYDIVSNPGQRSLESSTADFGHIPAQTVHEPAPSQAAQEKFDAVSWTAKAIQAYVRQALDGTPTYPSYVNEKTKRVYVDGIFDMFNTRHALQLRQAKLSFPSVHLIVGVYSDEQLQMYGHTALSQHVERCEVMRHCRWVDEVLMEAPWIMDLQFIKDKMIDYVALDEGTSVNPECHKSRLKGYDAVKSLGIVIPTRRTGGLSVSLPAQPTTPLADLKPGPEGLPLAKV